MRNKLLSVILLLAFLTACAPKKEEMPTALLPAGKAYADGKEIFFVHTEASDAVVAQLLTDMMSSPVLHVPALAEVPEGSLAHVYVSITGWRGWVLSDFKPMYSTTRPARTATRPCAASMS